MEKQDHNRTIACVLLGVTLLGISLHYDLLGCVAYALERGKIQANIDHLSTIQEADVVTLEQVSHAFSVIVDATKTSVVNIRSLSSDETIERLFEKHNLQAPPISGAGSGVIISEDGLIVTNNHVIADSEVIRVSLADGRKFNARIVGTDPKTDLAVIKIDASHLHPARFGDSEQVKAGHLVLAIGSPFRLSHSVSHGIVSAVGRSDVQVDIDYQNFIQTDAPINPGNSGGPLLNSRGEVIGINTAIATETGGHQGVGFAIPSNTVLHVARFLSEGEQIVRGYLGVGIKQVDYNTALAYGLDQAAGVFVQAVGKDSPAELGGLQPEDIVIAIDGRIVETLEELQERVAITVPGTTIEMTVWRQIAEEQYGEVRLNMTIGVQPEQFTTRGPLRRLNTPAQDGDVENETTEAIPTTDIERSPFEAAGFEAETFTPSLAKEFFIEPDITNGVVITRVSPTGEAYAANLRPGQVIVEANEAPITNLRELEDALSREALAQGVKIRLRAGPDTHYAVLMVR